MHFYLFTKPTINHGKHVQFFLWNWMGHSHIKPSTWWVANILNFWNQILTTNI